MCKKPVKSASRGAEGRREAEGRGVVLSSKQNNEAVLLHGVHTAGPA